MSAVSNDHRREALASLGLATVRRPGAERHADRMATCAVVQALVYIGDQIGRVADEVAEAQKAGGPLSAIAAALSGP